MVVPFTYNRIFLSNDKTKIIEVTDKGEATLKLALENSKLGTSVHCWCEGGNATNDDFVVPDHMAAEAERIVAKRQQEIKEMAEIMRTRRAVRVNQSLG